MTLTTRSKPAIRWLLGVIVCFNISAGDKPDPALLARIRQYAASYQMPDVAWDTAIAIYEKRVRENRFHKETVLYSNRYAHGGLEYWRAARSNGKPESGSDWKRASMSSRRNQDSRGFQDLAAEATALGWDRWETLDGIRTAVFNYRVKQQDSAWTLEEQGMSPVTLLYSGLIWTDPENGTILRISEEVAGFPTQSRTRSSASVTDYRSIRIGAAAYVLPIKKCDTTFRRDSVTRYEFSYERYRKFHVDSSVFFDR